MGRYAVHGPGAAAFLQSVFTNDVAALKIGQAHYGFLCNERGGVVDDVIIFRRGADAYWAIVNAGNRDKDWQWLDAHRRGPSTGSGRGAVTLRDDSADWSLIALQGPQALAILSQFTSLDFDTIPYYHCADTTVAGHEAFVARTGYTGEDGVEIAVRSEAIADLWTRLVEAGAVPCGLGARDTLRLEAAMALYGHELNDDTNPLEANLKRFIKMEKGEFVGRAALTQSLADGLKRKLVGLAMVDRGIARAGYALQAGGAPAGEVTSGAPAISLNQNIALAYVPVAYSPPGTPLDVLIRDRPARAQVVKTPFYSRKRRET
ncbi:MAG: glycine cleavage system aminomethyltransferase GcvT [Chloroflexi bacterium]|nr:glycine cleavage system aminomethyltransferase GcvT [Chloroflexota bacterium]